MSVSASGFTQTMTLAGTYKILVYRQVVFDTENAWSTTNAAYGIPFSGKYIISACWNSTAANSVGNYVSIWRNGLPVCLEESYTTNLNQNVFVEITRLVSCTANDVITFRAKSEANGVIISTSDPTLCKASITFVGV